MVSPNARVQLRAKVNRRERSELPKIARLLQRLVRLTALRRDVLDVRRVGSGNQLRACDAWAPTLFNMRDDRLGTPLVTPRVAVK